MVVLLFIMLVCIRFDINFGWCLCWKVRCYSGGVIVLFMFVCRVIFVWMFSVVMCVKLLVVIMLVGRLFISVLFISILLFCSIGGSMLGIVLDVCSVCYSGLCCCMYWLVLERLVVM